MPKTVADQFADALVAAGMPPAVTVEMAKGFTHFMVKTVMSGCGDEQIDLARSNLWR